MKKTRALDRLTASIVRFRVLLATCLVSSVALSLLGKPTVWSFGGYDTSIMWEYQPPTPPARCEPYKQQDWAEIAAGTCDVPAFTHQLNRAMDRERGTRREPLPLHYLAGCHLVFNNRLPKAGSRSLHDVVATLGESYNYSVTKHVGSGMGRGSAKDPRHQQKVDAFIEKMDQLKEPTVFMKHLYFLDLSRLPTKPLAMINVMRDPIEQVISIYSWKKYRDDYTQLRDQRDKMSLDECIEQYGTGRECFHWQMTSVPFFCDPQAGCWDIEEPSAERVSRAKWHVSNSFLAVGVLEDMGGFAEVLEVLLPQFFCGITEVYQQMESNSRALYMTSQHEDVSARTIAYMRKHLSHNHDLYQFTRQRFQRMLATIRAHQQWLATGRKSNW